MTSRMKTPGVYVVETSTAANSADEVATAVPAFIGYTEKAVDWSASLHNLPQRITSMTEFHNYFGGSPPVRFAVSELDATAARQPDHNDALAVHSHEKTFALKQSGDKYIFYWCMRSFFQNGGGACYVVSVGNYADTPAADDLIGGIDTLIKEPEPTMVVIPEAVLLESDDCIRVQQHSMRHCGSLRSRVSILDVHRGYEDRATGVDCITQFRTKLGSVGVEYAAAYYPWLETSLVQSADVGITTIDADSRKVLQALIKNDLGLVEVGATVEQEQQLQLIAQLGGEREADPARQTDDHRAREADLHKSLLMISGAYKQLFDNIKNAMNLLPPSAAMAGVYTTVDSTRGVWKAPANVSLNGVIRPSVDISHHEQEDLNVHAQGKSINAIRHFVGKGTMVWGARTLDGNSQDGRYINVRRTLIMIEQSLQRSLEPYVFEANDANTWVTIKSMARNFLTRIWRRGGLAGATPDDAFGVNVGLNETMTAEDIHEGIQRVTIFVAPMRPAEFIVMTFQQQMHES